MKTVSGKVVWHSLAYVIVHNWFVDCGGRPVEHKDAHHCRGMESVLPFT